MVEEKTAARGFMLKDYSSVEKDKIKKAVPSKYTGKKTFRYHIDRKDPYPCWN